MSYSFLLPSHISSRLIMTPASCSLTTSLFIITTTPDCSQSIRRLIIGAYARVLQKLPYKLGYSSHQCLCRHPYRWHSRCRLNLLEEPLCVLSGLLLVGLSFLETSSSHLLGSSRATYSHPVNCGVGSVLLFPCLPQHGLLIKS